MPMYFEGYQQAREQVKAMSEAELLEYIDGLYGRESLSRDASLLQIRAEALYQCRRDFTDTSSSEYDQVQFFTKISKASTGE